MSDPVLNSDVSADEARALHRVVRAMHLLETEFSRGACKAERCLVSHTLLVHPGNAPNETPGQQEPAAAGGNKRTA